MTRHRLVTLALLAACAWQAAAAQPPADPAVAGRTIDGKAFDLGSLRGKTVLLVFWSTECAVCRDKMPELRQGYRGWKGKPFEVVLISVDRRKQDLQDYERVIAGIVPPGQRFVQLWAGEPGYRDNLGRPQQLPLSLVIDKQGKVAKRYVGRMPTEAWNDIADLVY